MFDFAITRQIGHLRRYRQILNAFVRHGFGFALNLLPVERQWLRKLRATPVSEPQTLPSHFRQALEELGPTFVKLGQVLSTRPDVLPPAYIAELAKLRDTVPPVPWEEIHAVIESELGAPPETIFRTIDPEPMAAASLGQVHTATLANGDEVVVKVQRPDIQDIIDVDLSILKELARYTQLHTPLGKMYNMEEIAADFSETLLAEMDYRREGRNADRFQQNFAHEPGVYIPQVYWETTTGRVLVLEHLHGINIDDLEGIEAAGYDRHAIAQNAAQLIVKEMLQDGFFHADPHPGNLLIMDGNTIGAIDFGMVGYVSNQDRRDLIRLYTVAVRLDAEGAVDELIHIGAAEPDVDRRALTREVKNLLRRYAGLPLKEISAITLMQQVRPIVFRYRLHVPTNYWLLLKTLSMMEGVGRELDPNFDIFAFSHPYISRLLLQAILPNRQSVETLIRHGKLWGDFLGEVPRFGMLMLERIQDREPLPLSVDDRSLNRLDNLVTRLSLSLIITGILISLALIIPALSETQILLQVILIAGFLFALGLGGWLLITILRKH